MPEIAIYSGKGGELAQDVEDALKKLGLSAKRLDESNLSSTIKNCRVVIFPGGHTELLVSTLGEDGFEAIREFVLKGGSYIGICAGAYLAAPRVRVKGNPPGLGIIPIRNKRIRDIGIREIEISDNSHPITSGYSGQLPIYYQNGPFILLGKGVKVLAKFKTRGFRTYAAIVTARYGKGKVILFSPHPEGSSQGGIKPEEIGSLNLLKNAISFCLK